MAWDKTLPPGGSKISVGDNSIRDNNEELEDSLYLEHHFETGEIADPNGRHKFGVDITATRDGLTGRDGMIYFLTDVTNREKVLSLYSSGWENADVEPLDGSGNPTLPRVNGQSKFTVTQWADVEDVVPGGGEVAIDLDASPFKNATISGDTEIANPTGTEPANHTTTIQLELINSGAGHAITLGSDYRTVYNAGLVYDSADGRTNVFYLSRLKDGRWLVTVAGGLIA